MLKKLPELFCEAEVLRGLTRRRALLPPWKEAFNNRARRHRRDVGQDGSEYFEQVLTNDQNRY